MTLEKNWKNIWKSSKKLGRNFEEIGSNFLNKFSTHFDRHFEWLLRKFKKLEENFRENTIQF